MLLAKRVHQTSRTRTCIYKVSFLKQNLRSVPANCESTNQNIHVCKPSGTTMAHGNPTPTGPKHNGVSSPTGQQRGMQIHRSQARCLDAKKQFGIGRRVLLMEEIPNNHLGCIKPMSIVG